jgi:hypothetical protein
MHGVAPPHMCGRAASPLLGRGAGGRSPASFALERPDWGFADEMLTQLLSALASNPFEELEAATLNAAIALIPSVKPQTELEALIAVQIVATGFAGLKLLSRNGPDLLDVFRLQDLQPLGSRSRPRASARQQQSPCSGDFRHAAVRP